MEARLVLLALYGTTVVSLSACKTASSKAKDLPFEQISVMTEQQWVDACQAELENPQTGAKALADLQRFADSSDCRAAYPSVRNIYNHFKQAKID